MMQPDGKVKNTRQCRRCGTCCTKGGPAFHEEDRHLIEEGKIHTRFLYTIRRGELARDNLQDRLVPQRTDVIKIKGQGDTWTCRFYDRKGRGCTIYEHRPVECRALKCWDISDIKLIYATGRLTREDLLKNVEGLWELVADHQKRCSYRLLGELTGRLMEDDEGAAGEILEIVNYDAGLRPLLVENSGVDAEMIEFLLGRPLTATIRMFGLSIREKDGDQVLVKRPVSPSPQGRL